MQDSRSDRAHCAHAYNRFFGSPAFSVKIPGCFLLRRATPSSGQHEGPSDRDTLYGRGTCTLRALLTAEMNSACAALAARPPEGRPGATPSPAGRNGPSVLDTLYRLRGLYGGGCA